MTIPLSRPDVTEREIDSVMEVLRTPHLSLGPKLPEFEEKFARYAGVKHAIAVSSGTAGLHLALISLNIGDKFFLAETIKELFFFPIGPSSKILDDNKPTVPCTANFCLFPFFILISKTEESRLPNLAGNPPFIIVISLIASVLKMEIKPPK